MVRRETRVSGKSTLTILERQRKFNVVRYDTFTNSWAGCVVFIEFARNGLVIEYTTYQKSQTCNEICSSSNWALSDILLSPNTAKLDHCHIPREKKPSRYLRHVLAFCLLNRYFHSNVLSITQGKRKF